MPTHEIAIAVLESTLRNPAPNPARLRSIAYEATRLATSEDLHSTRLVYRLIAQTALTAYQQAKSKTT